MQGQARRMGTEDENWCGKCTGRRSRFVCVTAVARAGRAIAVVSDLANGVITEEPRGAGGFGYDPVFMFGELGRTCAELTSDQKNAYSHRGKSFRKLLYLNALGI